MSDESKEPRVSDVPYSYNSPWLVSQRTFLGMIAGSAAVCAGEGATSTGRSPTGSVGESDPVNLFPRLTPTPERVAGIARPRVDLNGTWRFNPSPAAQSRSSTQRFFIVANRKAGYLNYKSASGKASAHRSPLQKTCDLKPKES
jgi:hypothetical protein